MPWQGSTEWQCPAELYGPGSNAMTHWMHGCPGAHGCVQCWCFSCGFGHCKLTQFEYCQHWEYLGTWQLALHAQPTWLAVELPWPLMQVAAHLKLFQCIC